MTDPNDEFDRIIAGMGTDIPVQTIPQTSPYGPPAHPTKPGLTKRGKVVIAAGSAIIASTGLIGYQIYSANVAESEAKQQEIALQAKALDLQKIKELNRQAETDRQAVVSQEHARQASVDKCVKVNAHLAGNTLGSPSRRDVIDDCQAQYPTSTNTDDVQTAAAANDASTTGGGVNKGLLIGGAALGLFVVVAAKKGTRSNQS